ncbi:dimethyl sulfoxide reductase anchor subunit family protein [Pelosinus sp. sgz500959]|uniref:dimethyl sulfoxide reductase anchor subunit family protein n=1 Tax=Pelosinus sp. sgz500959 TaxID=3242472 RepID=UPI003671419F
MGEWALVLFTVLSQMAAGAFVTLWVLDQRTKKIDAAVGAFAAKGIVIIIGIGLAASTGHLGHPLEAYRALSHIGTSWLSAEVLLFGMFFVMVLVNCYQWQRGIDRKFTGAVGAAIALLAVMSSGMIYVLPARPAWNHFGPVLFFLLTAAVLGPLLISVLFKMKNYVVGKNVYLFEGAVLVIGLINFLLYLSMLMSMGDVATLTGKNMIMSAAFWPRILAGWLVPIGVIAYTALQREWNISRLMIALFVLTFIGEVLGRGMFFGSATALTIFGF